MAVTHAVGRRQYDTRSARIVDEIREDIILIDDDPGGDAFIAFYMPLDAKTVQQEKFEWDVDEFRATSDTTTAAVSSATQQTVTVSNPAYFVPGELWMEKTSGEIVRVDSRNIAQSQITVTRGVSALNSGGGTAAAASWASGTTLILLGPVAGEDNRRRTTLTTTPNTVFNFTQAMRWELALSRRQIKRSFKSGREELPYQTRKTMKEARRMLDGTFLAGERGRYTDPSEGDVTLTQGIRTAITSNVFAVGGTLYQANWNEWLVEEGLRRGSRNKTMVASTDFILAITEMTNDLVSFEAKPFGEMNVGIRVMEYMAPNGGQLMIVEDRFMSENLNGEAYLIDFTELERCVFSGNGVSDDLHIEENTEDPDDAGRAHTMYCDMGLQYGAEQHHGKLTDVQGGAKGRSVS